MVIPKEEQEIKGKLFVLITNRLDFCIVYKNWNNKLNLPLTMRGYRSSCSNFNVDVNNWRDILVPPL